MVVCFTGHRPNTLPGGYNYFSEPNIALGKALRKEIIKLIEQGASHFICGGALGVDQMAFMVCKKLRDQGYKITIELAIPFKNQPNKWMKDQRDRHEEHIKLADKVTYVDTLPGYKISGLMEGVYSPDKLKIRNNYMIDNCDKVIAVFTGIPSGTMHAINQAKKQGKEVIIIDPNNV